MKNFMNHIQMVYEQDQNTLLACSGGVDSVLLFFLLLNLQKIRNNFSFSVFHLSHNMPGNSQYSHQCQALVKQLTDQYQVPLYWQSVDLHKEHQERGGSLENLGRQYRYQFLSKLKQEHHFDTITTAHHQDDMVETILMRLFQGVSPKSFNPIQERRDEIVRPLLSFPKQEIYCLAQEQKFSYVEDPSNRDVQFKRNYIRHQIIPVIYERFPKFREKILSFGRLLEEQNAVIQKQLPVWNRQGNFFWIGLDVFQRITPYLCAESIKTIIMTVKNIYVKQVYLNTIVHYLKNLPVYNGDKILFQKDGVVLIRKKEILVCQEDL